MTSGLSKAFAMPGLRIGWTLGPQELIQQTWIRHDYTTLAPGMISDRLTAFAMDPVVRENIFARTRAIIRANLPQMEAWIQRQGDVFSYVRPVAGAIGYVKYDLPIGSTELVDRVRARSGRSCSCRATCSGSGRASATGSGSTSSTR